MDLRKEIIGAFTVVAAAAAAAVLGVSTPANAFFWSNPIPCDANIGQNLGQEAANRSRECGCSGHFDQATGWRLHTDARGVVTHRESSYCPSGGDSGSNSQNGSSGGYTPSTSDTPAGSTSDTPGPSQGL